jgi:hypothetical protein
VRAQRVAQHLGREGLGDVIIEARVEEALTIAR